MADITIKVALNPFPVPDGVSIEMPPGLRQEGVKSLPLVPLSDLDPVTLEQLCAIFRTTVFEKAGKQPPPTIAKGCTCEQNKV